MRNRALCTIVAVAIASLSTNVHAQTASRDTSVASTSSSALPSARTGFFASVGGAYGSAALHCDNCNTDRESTGSSYARLGGTLSPHLRLGFEAARWFKGEGTDETIVFYTAAAYWYPSVANNFWIKGAAGYATLEEQGLSDEFKQNGVGVSVGLGYDLAIGHSNFAVIPFADYSRQVTGKVNFEGSDTGVSANTNLFQIGVGIGFRH